mmetsp:Transcript_1849/g.3229  ORF Transcript_1849/g.3229 Transcript_1849/m.3229 type:complete len:92 (+) Transcript_1849:589-864(+)
MEDGNIMMRDKRMEEYIQQRMAEQGQKLMSLQKQLGLCSSDTSIKEEEGERRSEESLEVDKLRSETDIQKYVVDQILKGDFVKIDPVISKK